MISTRMLGMVVCLTLSVSALHSQGQFRALYLSGNVSLQDGSPPPDPARIELICSGRIEPQALTERSGRDFGTQSR
jgi:hypothetical protein